MIGHHQKLNRTTEVALTARELYEGMAAACMAYEELLANQLLIDPTTYDDGATVPIEKLYAVIGSAFQWTRDAALQLDLDVRWPPVFPVDDENVTDDKK